MAVLVRIAHLLLHKLTRWTQCLTSTRLAFCSRGYSSPLKTEQIKLKMILFGRPLSCSNMLAPKRHNLKPTCTLAIHRGCSNQPLIYISCTCEDPIISEVVLVIPHPYFVPPFFLDTFASSCSTFLNYLHLLAVGERPDIST